MNTKTVPDWSVLEEKGVGQMAGRVAGKLRRHPAYGETFVRMGKDLEREALVAAAFNADGAELGMGVLQHRVWCDVVDLHKARLRREDGDVSYEHRYDEPEHDDLLPQPRYVQELRELTDGYTDADVKALLRPALDRGSFGAMKVENAPDLDMPRGAPVLSTGNALATVCADVQRAWSTPGEHGGATAKQRRAMFMVLVLDWPLKTAAEHERITHQAVSQRINAGAARLVALLGGTDQVKAVAA